MMTDTRKLTFEMQNDLLDLIYQDYEYQHDRDPVKGITITDFLFVYRQNGQFRPTQVIEEKNLHPQQYEKRYSKTHTIMGMMIPYYQEIIAKVDESSPFLLMIMDELLSYSIYWAFISKNVAFLQQVIGDERCAISVVQWLNLWELFHYQLDSTDKSNELVEWQTLQQFEIKEGEIAKEINGDDNVSCITSIPVREVYLQIVTLL